MWNDNLPVVAIVGCYTLDLYCTSGRKHGYGGGMGQFTGRTETACIRDARRVGWTVTKGTEEHLDRVMCPTCKETS